MIHLKRLNDFFAAGVIFGAVNTMLTNLFPLVQILFGIKTRTPWGDLAALFFKPPQVYALSAQLFGFLATFGVGIANGIVIGGLLKFTGRDFAYLKSIVVCSSSVMFAFMILYPTLGLKADQYSIVTTYSALINNQIFAIATAYFFLRFTTIGQKEAENRTEDNKPVAKYRFIPAAARKPEPKEKKIRLLKPRLLKPKKL